MPTTTPPDPTTTTKTATTTTAPTTSFYSGYVQQRDDADDEDDDDDDDNDNDDDDNTIDVLCFVDSAFTTICAPLRSAGKRSPTTQSKCPLFSARTKAAGLQRPRKKTVK